MPVTYRIDKALHVVYVRWEGSVPIEEAIAHDDQLRADPDFAPDMAEISDARGVQMGHRNRSLAGTMPGLPIAPTVSKARNGSIIVDSLWISCHAALRPGTVCDNITKRLKSAYLRKIRMRTR